MDIIPDLRVFIASLSGLISRINQKKGSKVMPMRARPPPTISCYTPSDLLIVRQEMNIGQIQTISFRIAYGSEAYGELQEMLTGQVFLHDLNHLDSWEFPAADVYYLIAAPAYTIHADSNNNLLIKARTAYVKAGFPVSVKKDLSGELDRILQSAEGVMVEKERSGAK